MTMPWKNTIAVGPIRRLSDGGYAWKVTGHDWVTKSYFTDWRGEGLWVKDSWNGSTVVHHDGRYSAVGDDKQLLGTAQFSLPKSPSARRAKVVKYFTGY